VALLGKDAVEGSGTVLAGWQLYMVQTPSNVWDAKIYGQLQAKILPTRMKRLLTPIHTRTGL
jgi:hypothetical protein